MPDTNNSPAGGTGDALSVAEAADVLSGIIDDPIEDNVADDEDSAADKAGPDDTESDPEEDDEDGEGAEDDAEDPAEGKADAKADESQKKDGRFVEHTARVTLPDGTTTTVKDLIDGGLRQGDYTRKTQEVAELRKEFETRQQRVSQQAQQLDEQLAVNLEWLKLTRPERPAVSYEEDPVAYLRFQDESQRWGEAHNWVMGHINQRKAAFEAQQKEQLAAYERSEEAALLSAIPALRDGSKRRAFVAEVEKIAGEYGISPEELKGVKDHRQWLVLRDALAYRRTKARAPEVKKAIESKPPIKTGRRQDPNQSRKQAKQNRTERLKTEGTFDAGVAALMDMDL